jgi:hypothetical protein
MALILLFFTAVDAARLYLASCFIYFGQPRLSNAAPKAQRSPNICKFGPII